MDFADIDSAAALDEDLQREINDLFCDDVTMKLGGLPGNSVDTLDTGVFDGGVTDAFSSQQEAVAEQLAALEASLSTSRQQLELVEKERDLLQTELEGRAKRRKAERDQVLAMKDKQASALEASLVEAETRAREAEAMHQ
ncbi:hypothetical protein KIPB_009868, partial [Kipferlia bialata]|eukprot:g9868.t1